MRLKIILILSLCMAMTFIHTTTIVNVEKTTIEEIPNIKATKEIKIESGVEDENNLLKTVSSKQDKPKPLTKKEKFEKELDQLNKNNNDMEVWFKGYLKLADKYPKYIKKRSLSDTLSNKDIEYLYRMIETETYQANFKAKVRVANVAFNRLEDGRFGSDMESIITAKKQFTYFRTKISDDTKLAALYAYMLGDITDGALYFDSFKTKNKGLKYLFTDEVGHNFYYN